jgi:AcrR family transcriptional regulator
MDAIAAASGLTKRSIYYHFESKDALVYAVLQDQQMHALTLFESWSPKPTHTAAEFLTNFFDELGAWAGSANWRGSGFTRLTMELADLPGHPARKAARQHKRAIEDWLAVKLKDLDARRPQHQAREVALLIEGALSLILIHGNTDYAAAAGEAAAKLVARK